MGYNGIGITIIIEQGQYFHNTECCDNYINCFLDSNTEFSKGLIILGTLNGDIIFTDLTKLKSTEKVPGGFIIVIRVEALKALCENRISNDDRNM